MASNNNDLDFSIGTESALASFKALTDAYAKMAAGMTKEAAGLDKAMDHFAANMGKVNDRATQSQERYLRSLEKTAAVYGRTGVEKKIAERDFEIRKLGQQKDAIDRVTAAYSKMIAVEKGKGGGGGGGAESFGQNPLYAFRAIRDTFTGRTEFATVALGRLTYGLTGASVAATAGVAAIAGLGVAAYSAAKSLGEYSDEMNNAALRTGLTVTQVDHFKFAAQTVGQDIGVFEGSMRQLTAAVEDFSGEGDKARGALVKLGVNVRDLSGDVRPTADILMDLSVAINAIPTAFERNKVGMDIWKRKWLEIAPSIAAVSTQVKYAKEQGWGPTDADIAKLGKYDDILDRMAHSLGEMVRHMKTGLVDLFASIGDPRGVFNPLKYSGYTPQFSREEGMNLLGRGDGRPRYIPNPLAGGSAVASRILESAGSSRLEQMQSKASSLKSLVDESAAKLRQYATMPELWTDVAEKEGKIFQSRLSAYERQTAAIKAHNEALADTASITESLRKAEIDASDRMNRGAYFNLPSNRELREFARHRGLTSSDPRVRRMDLITEPERQRQMAEGVEKLQSDLTAEVTRAVHEQEAAYLSAGQAKLRLIALETISASIQAKTNDDARKSEEKLSATRIHTASILAADTPENRLQTEISLANVRQRSADRERENAEESINDTARRAELAAIARFPLLKQTGELEAVRQENVMNREMALRRAREQHEDELFQIGSDFDKKRAEEQRRQLDNIKQDVTSLLDTLFSHPSKFASQLGSTIRGAVLRPISDSIGERVAQSMRPSIYGADGTSGWAGSLRNIFGGSGGYSRPGASASSMTTDIPISIPSPAPGMDLSLPYDWDAYQQGGGVGQSLDSYAGLGAPGGSSGTFGSYNIPGLSGGRTGGGGMGGFDFSSLRESFNIGKRGIPGKMGLPGTTSTAFSDVLTSKGAASLMLAGGIPLALAGITGSRRGTWGGIGMSTIGGGLTGAGIGGMFGPLGMGIGAAIGTVAGFGIGLGEKLAGVESPSRQAKRLVQSQYGVSINDSMANSIVGIARQSYGGTVSIAVRSPEVRQMLGLYSAGTGQSMALSASTPRGAGLTQSGGSLFSNPVYQYGQSYSQSSPFPVYGGSGGGGSPTFISMHFDGKNAGDAMTGQFVSPTYVATASAAAWRGSQGRLDAAMALSQPGSIVS